MLFNHSGVVQLVSKKKGAYSKTSEHAAWSSLRILSSIVSTFGVEKALNFESSRTDGALENKLDEYFMEIDAIKDVLHPKSQRVQAAGHKHNAQCALSPSPPLQLCNSDSLLTNCNDLFSFQRLSYNRRF